MNKEAQNWPDMCEICNKQTRPGGKETVLTMKAREEAAAPKSVKKTKMTVGSEFLLTNSHS